MDAHDELVHQFESHTVKVSRRKQRKDFHTGSQVGKHFFGKCHIAPHSALWNHHTLGFTGGARGIVDHEQFVGRLAMIVDVRGLQSIGIGRFVKVFDHVLMVEETNLHARKFLFEMQGLKALSHMRAYKEHLCFAVFDESKHHLRSEIVEQRNGYCAIRKGCKQSDAPFGAVTATKSYAEAWFQAC